MFCRTFITVLLTSLSLLVGASCSASEVGFRVGEIHLGADQKNIEEYIGKEFSKCVHCSEDQRMIDLEVSDWPGGISKDLAAHGLDADDSDPLLTLMSCGGKICVINIGWIKAASNTLESLKQEFGEPSVMSDRGATRYQWTSESFDANLLVTDSGKAKLEVRKRLDWDR